VEPDLVEPVQIDYSPLDIVPNGLNVYDQDTQKAESIGIMAITSSAMAISYGVSPT
jgi:hypothetical protein